MYASHNHQCDAWRRVIELGATGAVTSRLFLLILLLVVQTATNAPRAAIIRSLLQCNV